MSMSSLLTAGPNPSLATPGSRERTKVWRIRKPCKGRCSSVPNSLPHRRPTDEKSVGKTGRHTESLETEMPTQAWPMRKGHEVGMKKEKGVVGAVN